MEVYGFMGCMCVLLGTSDARTNPTGSSRQTVVSCSPRDWKSESLELGQEQVKRRVVCVFERHSIPRLCPSTHTGTSHIDTQVKGIPEPLSYP